MTAASCSVPDCGATHYARSWCVTHYRRWQRGGDVRAEVMVAVRVQGGDGYAAVRRRLVRTHGPAAAKVCADCGDEAECWSYDGADPEELTSPVRGLRYSLDLAHYRPRCRYCHRRAVSARAADLPGAPAARGRRFDIERAAALYRAGASCRGIGSLMGVSADATRRALRTHGVPLRPSGRAHRRTPY
jgi:hypothetical protein